ncbi:unnamed protein product [Nezara viridula]|uniref:Uncharacterized protein n=1 Tax=Nezara viridula TaxID=85310 RepID=A0A9P0HDQ0_NEZVI|nr:unnamed protein product [Nezara viridula]
MIGFQESSRRWDQGQLFGISFCFPNRNNRVDSKNDSYDSQTANVGRGNNAICLESKSCPNEGRRQGNGAFGCGEPSASKKLADIRLPKPLPLNMRSPFTEWAINVPKSQITKANTLAAGSSQTNPYGPGSQQNEQRAIG